VKKVDKDGRRRAIRLKLNELSPFNAYSYFCRKCVQVDRSTFDVMLSRFTFYQIVLIFKKHGLSVLLPARPDRDHIITSGGGVHNIDENVKWDISRDSNLASVDCMVVNRIGPSGSLAGDENLILEVRSAGCLLAVYPVSDNCVRLELRQRR